MQGGGGEEYPPLPGKGGQEQRPGESQVEKEISEDKMSCPGETRCLDLSNLPTTFPPRSEGALPGDD